MNAQANNIPNIPVAPQTNNKVANTQAPNKTKPVEKADTSKERDSLNIANDEAVESSSFISVLKQVVEVKPEEIIQTEEVEEFEVENNEITDDDLLALMENFLMIMQEIPVEEREQILEQLTNSSSLEQSQSILMTVVPKEMQVKVEELFNNADFDGDFESLLNNMESNKISIEFGDTNQSSEFSFDKHNLLNAGKQPEIKSYVDEVNQELEQLNVTTQTMTQPKEEVSIIDNKITQSISDAPRVAEQLKVGFEENTGKTEFTLRLNPESLGEVTVKLVQEDGQSVLKIITANPLATELINKDLPELREVMRHMQINVEDSKVVEESNEAFGNQFDMNSENFKDQQQNFTSSQKTVADYLGMEELEVEEEQVLEVDTNNLSIYI